MDSAVRRAIDRRRGGVSVHTNSVRRSSPRWSDADELLTRATKITGNKNCSNTSSAY
jgi:hypothetical protein